MKSAVLDARVRVSGRARLARGERGRSALLLTTALGCSLLVAAAAGEARAQSIQQHVEGDLTIAQDVVNGSPFAVDATSDAGNVTIDVGQANVTNDGAADGYAVHAVTDAADKLISVSLDESTATGTGGVFGINAEASGGSGILITAGAIEATGDGEYGIRAATQNGGSITIDSGTVTTTGGILNPGTADARNAFGVWAMSDSGDIEVASDSVTTTGFGATGIVAQTASGDVSIDSGAISTSQAFASGIGAAGANLTIASDTITTAGDASAGIYVPTATGDVTVTSGEITTAGQAIEVDGVLYLSPGIVVRDGEHVSITSDQVTTTGSGGYGITADNIGSLTLTSGAVHTSGDAGIGINTDAVGGAIDITSQSVITDGEFVLYAGEYTGADGILAVGEGPITIDSGSVTTSGAMARGIFASSSDGNVSVTSGSVVTTGASFAGGIRADSGTGDVSIDSDSVSIAGDFSPAIWADGHDVTITSGTIEATGTASSAIYVLEATGDVTVTSDQITTTGSPSVYDGVLYFAPGIVVRDGENVSVTSNQVTTSGDGGHGITVDQVGSLTLVSGTVHTSGKAAMGINADAVAGAIDITSQTVITDGDLVTYEGANYGSYGINAKGEGPITIDSGSVTTSGSLAHGFLVDGGAGDISIASDEIVTKGASAHGIYVANAGGGDIAGLGNWRAASGGTGALTIASGSIDAAGFGMMIDHQGSIDITSDSIVSAGPAIYIYGGDTITIDSGSVAAQYGAGIVAWGSNGDINVTAGDTWVGENGDAAIFAGTQSGDVFITAGDTTTTVVGLAPSGYAATAIDGVTNHGDVTIVSGATHTHGMYSAGVGAGASDGNVTVTSESVENSGVIGSGVYVTASGSVSVDSGSIAMSGDGALGVYINAGGPVSIASDSIVSTGARHEENDGRGIWVTSGAGVDIDSGLISTQGDSVAAMEVAAGSGHVTIVSGEITTAGDDANGILVSDSASADVTTGNIATAGAGSVAVSVVSTGAINVDVTGDVAAAQGWGLKARTSSDNAIGISVESGASIHGAEGAIGLDSDNDATLTVYGHIGSDADATVLLAGGDDVVDLKTGANIEGGLYGGAGFDTLNLDSTVNDGAGIGQSVDNVVDFEALNLKNGRWTVGGDLALETTLTGGTLVVTGSLTDDVVIGQNAALQIGDGGTTGTLVGDLVIDGTAIFDRADEYDFGGDVSGTGTLVKQGDAGLILSGAYSFTGTTQVEGGTIKIVNLPQTAEVVVDDGVLDLTGTDQELASLSGGSDGVVDVDDGSLTVNQDGSTTFAGEITGDGSLTLSGGGTLNLTGDNTYTGPTTVDEGLLKVNGSITSDVTVNDGGTLGGSGTINGDVAIGDGGAVGPGNSPGTQTVMGDFTFAAGSTYVAEVLPTGEHDLINVSGQTTIADGVTLSIMAGAGDWARLSNFTLLHSVGGLTGTFDTVETNLAFLDPHVTYTATDILLALTRNDISFDSFAANANQANVAGAIEGASYGDPLYDAVVVQSAEGSRQAYNALSGEIYAGLGSVLLQQSRYHRDAIVERAANAGEGAAGWGQLIGADLDFDGDASHASVDSQAGGLIAGADAAVGGWRVGAAVSYLRSDVDSAALASTLDVNSTTLSAYAGGQAGPLKATLGASYARHDIDANRVVTFPSFSDAPKASFEAMSAEIFAELSMSHQLSGVLLEPFLGVSHERLKVDGFTEEGGAAALTVDADTREVSTASLGLRASTSFDTEAGKLTPYATIAWRGVSGDKDQPLGAAFQSGAAYNVTAAPIDDGLIYELGVRVSSDRAGFTASYSGMTTDRWTDQQARIGLSVRF